MEEKKLKLYKVVNKIGVYWVIATDPTDAEKKLYKILNEADYGFYEHRKVTEIHLIAEEVYERPFGLTNNFLIK